MIDGCAGNELGTLITRHAYGCLPLRAHRSRKANGENGSQNQGRQRENKGDSFLPIAHCRTELGIAIRDVNVRAVDTLFAIKELLNAVIAAGTPDGDATVGMAGIIAGIAFDFCSVLSSMRTMVSSTAFGSRLAWAVEEAV